MKCENCKYWDTDYSYNRVKVRKCLKAIHIDQCEEWKVIDDVTKNVIKEEYKDQKMFVEDASSYYAVLYTKEDFFCAHYEAK